MSSLYRLTMWVGSSFTRRVLVIFFVGVISLLAVYLHTNILNVSAVANNTINFQGKIVNKTDGTNLLDGTPSCIVAGVSNDTCDFRISIYSDESGGTLLWQEPHSNVEIGSYNGVFNLGLNSVCTSWAAPGGSCSGSGIVWGADSTIYMEIEFDDDGNGDFVTAETFGRKLFNSVPFAYYADEAGSLSGSTASDFLSSNTSDTYEGGSTNTLTVQSLLSAANRAVPLIQVIQINDVTYDSTANLMELFQQDTASSSMAMYIQNYGSGASFRIDDVSGDTTPFIIDADGNVGIGTASPLARLHIAGSVDDEQLIIDANSTQTVNILEIRDGGGNILGGHDSLGRLFSYSGTDTSNFFIDGGGNSTMTGVSNKAIGYMALTNNTTGGSNLAIGSSVLYSNLTGSNNVALGFNTLNAMTSGDGNVAVSGQKALTNLTSGNYNVAFGWKAGVQLTSGDNNILIGPNTVGVATTGSANIIIGNDIDFPAVNGSNQMTIGNLIFGTGIDGIGTTVSTGGIGIGIVDPGVYKLNVSGSLIATDFYSGDGTQGATTTVSGLTFKDGLFTSGSVSGSGIWTKTGIIAHLTSATDDLAIGGSTSSAPLFFDESAELLILTNTTAGDSFRVNDEASDGTPFIIDASGNVGIGTESPLVAFHVVGDAHIGFTGGSIKVRDNTALELNGDISTIGYGPYVNSNTLQISGAKTYDGVSDDEYIQLISDLIVDGTANASSDYIRNIGSYFEYNSSYDIGGLFGIDNKIESFGTGNPGWITGISSVASDSGGGDIPYGITGISTSGTSTMNDGDSKTIGSLTGTSSTGRLMTGTEYLTATTGTYTSIYGVRSTASIISRSDNSTITLTDFYGINASASVRSSISPGSIVNITNSYGIKTNIYSAVIDGATATITNAYGNYIGDTNLLSGGGYTNGVTTNLYGLYIEDIDAGTNNYAIYSEGGDSYFGGSIGIGDPSPDAPLDVVGDVYISDGLSLYETAVSDGTIEATKFCTGDNETNCVTDFSTLVSGAGIWTKTGIIAHLASATDDLAIGGSTSSAPLFFDESAEILILTNTTGGDSFRINDEAGDGTPFMIDGDGNVGIGITSPTEKLDVFGNIKATNGYFTNTLNTSFSNMVRNGSFENGITYWTVSNGGGSDGAISAYAVDSYTGVNSLRYQRTVFGTWSVWNNSLSSYLPSPYFNTNQTYTLSFYTKALSGTPSLFVSILDSNGSNSVTACSGLVLSSEWQQFTCTFTPTIEGVAPTIYYTANSPASVDILIDGIMLTTGDQAYGYTTLQADHSDNIFLNSDFYVMGDVGIGTDNPSTALDVNGVITATGGNSTNWNTAYGWGDHSTQGYLTSATNNYIDGLSFNTVDGVITVTRSGLVDLAVDLDGRYLEDECVNCINATEIEDIYVLNAGDSMTGNLSVTGSIYASSAVETGEGSGSVSLTINDGYGNANLAFNHHSGVPDSSGSANRIETGVDGTTGSFSFEIGDNVTSGTAVGLSQVMLMTTSAIDSQVNFDANAGLDVTGLLSLVGSSSNIALGSNYLSGDGGDEGVYIASDGNVGVGTNNPGTYKLNVAGTGFFTGDLYADSRIYVDNATNYLSYPTGDYGSIQINGGGKNNYEGFSIDGRFAFMHDGGSIVGIYNDVDNEWMTYGTRNGAYGLRYDGAVRIETSNAGATVSGIITATGGTSTNWNTAFGWGDHSGLYVERGVVKIVLEPEYEGAVLSADGSSNIGSMMADNAGSADWWKNYYEWSSSETALNDYDVRVRFTLPSDFSSWGTNAIVIDYVTQTVSSADNQFDVSLYLENSATADATDNDNVSSGAGAWTTTSILGTSLTECNAAGETCTLILRMFSKNDNYMRVGDITLNYNN